jgi:hypothetical protein
VMGAAPSGARVAGASEKLERPPRRLNSRGKR